MSLFPFYRHRFFNDPFFFYDFDFYDPWYDFDLFPPFVPITPRYRSFKRKERLTYSSTNTSNNSRSLEQIPQVPISVPIQKRIESRQEQHSYINRETRKTYNNGGQTETNALTSYSSPSNNLALDVPIQTAETRRQLEQQARNNNRSLTQFGQYDDLSIDNIGSINDSNLQVRTVDKGNNQKQLEVDVDVKNYQPQDLKVSVKNNELIVQGEYQRKEANRSERSTFYKSSTLPRGTQVQQLQAYLDNGGQLKIEGPVS